MHPQMHTSFALSSHDFVKYTLDKISGMQTAQNNEINLDEILFTAD